MPRVTESRGEGDVVGQREARPRAVRSPELLGQRDDDPFRSAEVAEPVGILELGDLADECRAVPAEPSRDALSSTITSVSNGTAARSRAIESRQ